MTRSVAYTMARYVWSTTRLAVGRGSLQSRLNNGFYWFMAAMGWKR